MKKKVGQVNITSNYVFVCDPAFINRAPVVQLSSSGIYNCYICKHDTDNTIRSISIIRSDYICRKREYTNSLTPVKCFNVESGISGIFNSNISSEYSNSKSEFNRLRKSSFKYKELKHKYTPNSNFYNSCCNCALNNKGYNIIKNIGFVSSGNSDGLYKVYPITTIKNNEVIGIKIKTC